MWGFFDAYDPIGARGIYHPFWCFLGDIDPIGARGICRPFWCKNGGFIPPFVRYFLPATPLFCPLVVAAQRAPTRAEPPPCAPRAPRTPRTPSALARQSPRRARRGCGRGEFARLIARAMILNTCALVSAHKGSDIALALTLEVLEPCRRYRYCNVQNALRVVCTHV